jgi:hypothetical protein
MSLVELTIGKAIAEDGRTVGREKYSELKLEANFLKVSPGYLTATASEPRVGVYSSSFMITATRLQGSDIGDFFIIRHTAYGSKGSTEYFLKLPISLANLTMLPINSTEPFEDTIRTGLLTLNGRDSKIIVTNYDVRGTRLLYCTAEILTHQKFANKTILMVYSGGANETNEMVVMTSASPEVISGVAVNVTKIRSTPDLQVLRFTTVSRETSIVKLGDFWVYIMGKPTLPITLHGMLTTFRSKRSIQILGDGLGRRNIPSHYQRALPRSLSITVSKLGPHTG